MKLSKNYKRNPNRVRFGIVALLASLGGLASVLRTYDGEVYMLSRQAALRVQESAGYVEKQCSLAQTSKINVPSIVIDKPVIRAQSQDRLQQLKQFTRPDYEKYMTDVAGKEHYTLLHWLISTFHSKDDCRHVVDIGTRFVTSALALGATGIPVKTFDIPMSAERTLAFRGKTEQQWQDQVKGENIDIQFYNLNLLEVSDEDFRKYMATWFVILDTFHKPYSVPFEREFLSRLVSMEPKFEGVLVLDDINLGPEMRQWWQEVQHNAEQWGYTAYDLTSIGHASGTGLLDFSGKVAIKE